MPKVGAPDFSDIEDRKFPRIAGDPGRLAIVDQLRCSDRAPVELAAALEMPSNLISHHLRVLRQAGLVDVERDALDARWVYYSLNRAALDDLNAAFGRFFDPDRIKPRRPTCGPQGAVVPLSAVTGAAR